MSSSTADDFERSTPGKGWEISKPAGVFAHLHTRADVDAGLMIDVFCSGCKELVGRAGLAPREGAGIKMMKFTCPCGASTKWESP